MAEDDMKKKVAKAILKDKVILTGYITAMNVTYDPILMPVGGPGCPIPKGPRDVKIDLTISAETLGECDVFRSSALGPKKILIMEIE